MTRVRLIFALLGALAISSSHALTPLPDSSLGFFAGDWIGTGAEDEFCFIHLQTDGVGTVLVRSASGDWLGARIRWRNQRQNVLLIDVSPLPADPQRRLMPLAQLSLRSGINRTLQLKLNAANSVCELQLRTDVMRRADEAGLLFDSATAMRKPHGGK